jgi:CheY-like chemotaxis protein
MLFELGSAVDSCSDGAEAVVRYRSALESGMPYDAVILDLTVPGGMGGLEAARQIRVLDPEATLIVSSGYSHDAAMADFREHGFSGAVMKPYSIDILSEELTKVMRNRRCSAEMADNTL